MSKRPGDADISCWRDRRTDGPEGCDYLRRQQAPVSKIGEKFSPTKLRIEEIVKIFRDN